MSKLQKWASSLSVLAILTGILAWLTFFYLPVTDSQSPPMYVPNEQALEEIGEWLLRWVLWNFVIPGVLAVVAFVSGMLALETGKRSRLLGRCLAVIGAALGGLLPFLACVVMLLQR
ncbi:MAG: hypothetical protein U9R15_09505 [Chloroflexota bacterium]|nr:hypothetical protein [Chloroflexota bacterium]